MKYGRFILCVAILASAAAADVRADVRVDLMIRNGMIYDGKSAAPYAGDIAVDGGLVAAVGNLAGYTGRTEVDAKGLAVAPGFINMLS